MLNADEYTVSVRWKAVTNDGDHSFLAVVYSCTSHVQTSKHTWRTDGCSTHTHMHTHAAVDTHIYWIVPINMFFVVSKNLMMEKLAVGTDCLSRRISALKCPLPLLFLRQCRLYILLIDKGTAHRFSRLLKMMYLNPTWFIWPGVIIRHLTHKPNTV